MYLTPLRWRTKVTCFLPWAMIAAVKSRGTWRSVMALGFFNSPASTALNGCARRRISPTLATGGMIASQHPLVSSTGLRVMACGGNAVDAAVAAALVGTVVMPGRCGLGGDLLAVAARAGSGGVS